MNNQMHIHGQCYWLWPQSIELALSPCLLTRKSKSDIKDQNHLLVYFLRLSLYIILWNSVAPCDIWEIVIFQAYADIIAHIIRFLHLLGDLFAFTIDILRQGLWTNQNEIFERYIDIIGGRQRHILAHALCVLDICIIVINATGRIQKILIGLLC